MPYMYSQQELAAQVPIKSKNVHVPVQEVRTRSTSSASSASSASSTSSTPTTPAHEPRRASGEHNFVVANMFGPIDWADNLVFEAESEPERPRVEPLMGANMFGPTDWIEEMEAKLTAQARK